MSGLSLTTRQTGLVLRNGWRLDPWTIDEAPVLRRDLSPGSPKSSLCERWVCLAPLRIFKRLSCRGINRRRFINVSGFSLQAILWWSTTCCPLHPDIGTVRLVCVCECVCWIWGLPFYRENTFIGRISAFVSPCANVVLNSPDIPSTFCLYSFIFASSPGHQIDSPALSETAYAFTANVLFPSYPF